MLVILFYLGELIPHFIQLSVLRLKVTVLALQHSHLISQILLELLNYFVELSQLFVLRVDFNTCLVHVYLQVSDSFLQLSDLLQTFIAIYSQLALSGFQLMYFGLCFD